jgi:hypothetical protein
MVTCVCVGAGHEQGGFDRQHIEISQSQGRLSDAAFGAVFSVHLDSSSDSDALNRENLPAQAKAWRPEL